MSYAQHFGSSCMHARVHVGAEGSIVTAGCSCAALGAEHKAKSIGLAD